MANKKEKEKLEHKRETLNLKEFLVLKDKDQKRKINDILNEFYDGKLEVTEKHVNKVLDICFDTRDNEVYLPHSLKVDKHGSVLTFHYVEKNNWWLIVLFLACLLFAAIAATYSGVKYLRKANLNIDLDGDGIADINLDLNDDEICDVNCDENKDNKPDKNIDYKGNRKPIFNVLRKDESIFNPVNQDIDNDGKCDINCDTNSDGWPDMNIDYDGDGEVDLDIDTNGDGIKDMNIDTNSDGVCDINCDDDNDGVCDRNCINVNIPENGEGTSSEVGNGGLDFTSASLIVLFESQNKVVAENIFPDDQEGNVNTVIPDLKFTVENTTDNTIYYDVSWVITENTFESDNFWYKISSTNDGFNKTWGTAPFVTKKIASKVSIAPHTKQSYIVSMTLHGTGEEQNYDQNKTFNGKIKIDMQ